MIHETLNFSIWFPKTCSKCFSVVFFLFKLMEAAAAGGKNPARVVWCLCWMGEFFCASWADVSATSSVSQIAFIVTSCWVWSTYTHLSLRGCFQSRPKIWFYKCFSKIISRPLPAIQTRSLQWALAQLSGKEWGWTPRPTLLRDWALLPIIDAV